MLPFLTFASGLLIGGLGMKLARDARGAKAETAREALAKGEAKMRRAAASGLDAVEKTAADLRRRVDPAPEAPAPKASAAPKAAPKASPARKPRTKKAVPPAEGSAE